MDTRYVSPEKFSKVSKGKKVVDYPNPWIKDVNGIRHHIINPDMEYKISVLEKKSYPWYFGMTYEDYAKETKEMFGDEDARVFVLECDWFPTELVAGVDDDVEDTDKVWQGAKQWIDGGLCIPVEGHYDTCSGALDAAIMSAIKQVS